jgi:hypothetical protein
VGAAGGIALIVLNAAAVTAILTTAPAVGLAAGLASLASLTRLTWTTHAVPPLIAHRPGPYRTLVTPTSGYEPGRR